MSLAQAVMVPGLGGDFSPMDISGNQLCYTGTTITSAGGFVTQWSDKASRHVSTQGAGSAQPALISGGLSGHGTVRFDGSNDFLTNTTLTLAQPLTVVLIAKQITWTVFDRFFDNAATDGPLMNQYNGPSPEVAIYAGSSFTSYNSNLPLDTWKIFRAYFNAGSSYIQIQNGTKIGGNPGVGGFSGGFKLGSKFDGTSNANIEIAEFNIYNKELDDNEWLLLRDHASDTYGVS